MQPTRHANSAHAVARVALIVATTLVLPWLGAAGAAGLQQRYATEHEALQEAFPAAATFVLQRLVLPEPLRARLQAQLRRQVPPGPLRVYLAYDQDAGFRGYGVVAEEIGKHRPITFLVAMDPQPSVLEVQVLVYRESRGGEVAYPRFLRQYQGKRPEDRLRVGREILNVTGATLSVLAVTAGVRRVLGSIRGLFPDGAPDLESARTGAIEVFEPGGPPGQHHPGEDQ